MKLAVPMFLTQLALQLIQVNSVIQSGNYSTDVKRELCWQEIWFPIMVGIGFMVAQLYGAKITLQL